jgi:hypothetical protein
MTAAAAASQDRRPGPQTAAVPLRQLVRVTARQHRIALLWVGIFVAVMAVALGVTGALVHELASRGGFRWYGESSASVEYGGWVLQLFQLALQLGPLLAGMFLGAPLLPRETEHGTAWLAWTQATSRPRWLLSQVLPVAGLLALAGLGLGAELAWWLAPFPNVITTTYTAWSPLLFNLTPLLLAAWAVFAFTLGVFLGSVSRRTLPAMAATLGCYGALLFEVTTTWRMHYLAPLNRAFALSFSSDGTYGVRTYWPHQLPVTMREALGRPDGRLLSYAETLRPAAWLRLHHVVMQVTYQPASRFHTFQLIELGWLVAASALLVAAAIFLIRRRPA